MDAAQIIFVDNTRDWNRAKFSPILMDVLGQLGHVVKVRTQAEAAAAMARPVDAIVLSGSMHTITEDIDQDVLATNAFVLFNAKDTPVLGICFGMQIMTLLLGGSVERLASECEGEHDIDLRQSVLFPRRRRISTLHAHVDAVTRPPTDFVITATISHRPGVAVAFENRKATRFGVQFHPEALEETRQILERFVRHAVRRRRHTLGRGLGILTFVGLGLSLVALGRQGDAR